MTSFMKKQLPPANAYLTHFEQKVSSLLTPVTGLWGLGNQERAATSRAGGGKAGGRCHTWQVESPVGLLIEYRHHCLQCLRARQVT